jgi:hypothetical protein
MNVVEFTCPCGITHEAWTVGIHKNGQYAEQVFDMQPKKCLHAYYALGTQLRRKGKKITVIGRGRMREVVKRFGV